MLELLKEIFYCTHTYRHRYTHTYTHACTHTDTSHRSMVSVNSPASSSVGNGNLYDNTRSSNTNNTDTHTHSYLFWITPKFCNLI